MHVVNLKQKFEKFSDHWSPKIVGEVKDFHVKVAKFQGEFPFHTHENEDELFLVVKGSITIRFEESEKRVNEGEFLVVPKGVMHAPFAEEEAHVLLLEPKTVINTGDQVTGQTVTDLERI